MIDSDPRRHEPGRRPRYPAHVDTRTRRHNDRATTLVLVPTMMIVFMALAAIAIDLTSMHVVKRRAIDVVSTAASDGAGMLDEAALQLTGVVRIDDRRAEKVVAAHLATDRVGGTITDGPHVVVSSDGLSLTVSLRVQVDHVFLAGIPALRSDEFPVRATAHLVTDD